MSSTRFLFSGANELGYGVHLVMFREIIFFFGRCIAHFSAKLAHHVQSQGETDNIVKFSCLLCLPNKTDSTFANSPSIILV